MPDGTAYAAAMVLLFGVLPLWSVAGLADYFCHRASSIETTSGPWESLLHLMQLGLMGFPVLLGLVLEINAGLLLLMLACLLLHHWVAWLDISYANNTRIVAPVEQMIHSLLEILPWTAFLLAGILYWDQLTALFTAPAHADFAPRFKTHPLPMAYIATFLTQAFLLNVLPSLEEMARTLRVAWAIPPGAPLPPER
jgi:hypothetical protein